MKQNYFFTVLKSNKLKTLLFCLFAFSFSNGQYTSSTIATGFGNLVLGIATDSAGNVYVTDFSNGIIKKMDANGQGLTTLASNLSQPTGIAVAGNGEIYFTDFGNGEVKKMSANGQTITTFANGLNQPAGITLDSSGNVYVANSGSNEIVKISANGMNRQTLGSGFSNPWDVKLDTTGNIYVADRLNSQIIKMDANGQGITTIRSGFTSPRAIALDGYNNIFVCNNGGNSLQRMTTTGSNIININNGQFWAVALDGAGNLYYDESGVIKKINSSLLTTNNIAKSYFSVSPNPAKDFVTISNVARGSDVSLYDMTGKQLYSTKATGTTVTINTSSYQSGVYILKVDGQSSKLLISK